MKLTLTRCLAIGAIAAAPCYGLAQSTKWAVEPDYESMTLYPQAVAAQKDGKVTFFSLDGGSKLFEADGSAMADADGNVFITDADGQVSAFINAAGKKVDVTPAVMPIGEPAFVDGLLMYTSGKSYGTVDTDGNRHDMPAGVVRAFPYSHGFAMYQAYENPGKKKGLHYGYSSLGSEVSYDIDGKETKPEDVKFLSSVAPDGRGVAVIGSGLYWFDSAEGKFEPMLLEGAQPMLNERTVAALQDFGKDIFTFRGKIDGKQSVTVCFNKELAPEKVVYDGMTMTFDAPQQSSSAAKSVAAAKPASNFSVEKQDSSFVLKYKGATVPSSAYQAVTDAFGDYAIAKADGKWGIITCIPRVELGFTLLGAADSENIAFRHAKAKGSLLVDIPAGVDASAVDIEVPDSMKQLISINKFGREERTAGGVTRLTYPVTLGMPASITDMVTEISYPVDVIIGGAKQYTADVKTGAWYVKNYIMDFNPDHVPALDAYGNVQFIVDITKDQPDACDYPLCVSLVPEIAGSPTAWQVSKLTETKYCFTLSNLMPGTNRFWVVMNEEGCPSYSLPFEIENTSVQAAPQPAPQQQYQQPVQYAQQPMQQQYQQVAQQPVQPVQQPMQQPMAQPVQQPMQQVQQQPMVQQQYQQPAPVQQMQQQPIVQQPAQQQYQQVVQQPAPQQYQQPVAQQPAPQQQAKVFKL